MSKNQYQSTEILKIRIAPFVNKVTGDYITTGLDTCTLTIKRPDGSALPSGPHTATWDSTVHMWTFDVPVISYQQGEWRVKAVSSDSNALPKWWVGNWGDYVDDITATKTTATSIKTDTTSLVTSAAAIKAKTDNLPASPASETTAASAVTEATAAKTAAQAAQTAAVAAQADAAQLKKAALNRWKIQGTQLLIYEDNGTTIFKTYDLKDSAGQPSSTTIFERVPV